MRYVVKAVSTGLEGQHEGTRYYICDTEREMQRMLNAFKEQSYLSVTCLGPVATPANWMQNIIDKHV